MPIEVIDNGAGNRVEIAKDVLAKGSGNITLDGDNNFISIASSALALGGIFHLKGNARVEIGEHVVAPQLFVYTVHGTELRIGDGVGFNGLVRLLMHEAGKMTIGDHCLFASEVDVTISDMHSIIDISTQKRINFAKNVIIGNRVWVGQRSMILKGAQIGDGSVIGAQSVVTGSIPPNCAAAGNPARLIRPNITWDQRLL